MALKSPPNNNKNIFTEIEGASFMELKPPPITIIYLMK